MFFELLIASVGVMMASLIGVVLIWLNAGALIERNLNYLVSFAAGVFIILVFFLSQEVIAEASSEAIGFMWILAGLVLLWILLKILPESHHHHHDAEAEPHDKLDARRLLIADGFHNVGDGILLAAAFLSSAALGITAAISIFVHELVQEVSEFFVLKQAGHSTRSALKLNFLTASTILIGSIGGYFFLGYFRIFEIPVLGIATGALIALLLEDIIPHSLHHAQDRKCTWKHILAVALGALLMYSVFQIGAEAHIHG